MNPAPPATKDRVDMASEHTPQSRIRQAMASTTASVRAVGRVDPRRFHAYTAEAATTHVGSSLATMGAP